LLIRNNNKSRYNKGKHKRIDKTHNKGQQKRIKGAYKKLPTYKTSYKIILNIPKIEIPKSFLIDQPFSSL
jgi:hypothetical protein